MEYIKFWLRWIDIWWYVGMVLAAPFAIAVIMYLCPVVVVFLMVSMILYFQTKTSLAWRLWRADRSGNEMHGRAIQNTVKTFTLALVCALSMWLAVWGTIWCCDEEGAELCVNNPHMPSFTMPQIILHFYTPTCGPKKPSWLDHPDAIFDYL
jgi:hypothetical protein